MAQLLSIRQGMGDFRGYTIYRPGRTQRVFLLLLMIVCAGITGLVLLTCSSMLQTLIAEFSIGYALRIVVLLVASYVMASATVLLSELGAMYVAISRNKLVYRAFGASAELAYSDIQGFSETGSGLWRVWGLALRQPITVRRSIAFYIMALLNPMVHNGQLDRMIPLNPYYSGTIHAFMQTAMGEQLLQSAPHLRPDEALPLMSSRVHGS